MGAASSILRINRSMCKAWLRHTLLRLANNLVIGYHVAVVMHRAVSSVPEKNCPNAPGTWIVLSATYDKDALAA